MTFLRVLRYVAVTVVLFALIDAFRGGDSWQDIAFILGAVAIVWLFEGEESDRDGDWF